MRERTREQLGSLPRCNNREWRTAEEGPQRRFLRDSAKKSASMRYNCNTHVSAGRSHAQTTRASQQRKTVRAHIGEGVDQSLALPHTVLLLLLNEVMRGDEVAVRVLSNVHRGHGARRHGLRVPRAMRQCMFIANCVRAHLGSKIGPAQESSRSRQACEKSRRGPISARFGLLPRLGEQTDGEAIDRQGRCLRTLRATRFAAVVRPRVLTACSIFAAFRSNLEFCGWGCSAVRTAKIGHSELVPLSLTQAQTSPPKT